MQKGTKHKVESIQAIKEKRKEKWQTISPEERKQIMQERVLVRTKNKENKYAI
jgi:hypothetical protein